MNVDQTSKVAQDAVLGDLVILAALCLAGCASLAIGSYYGAMTMAAIGSCILIGLGALSYVFARESLCSRMILALALSGMVALHIQLGRGTLEFHFGVFATLALLLVYRDWRPILASASFYAVQHVLFDRLQAQGYQIYCTTEPNFLRILMHAGYLVIQTSLEILMAVWMKRLESAGLELQALLRSIDNDQSICLDVSSVVTATPQGRTMKSVVSRVSEVLHQVQSSIEEIKTASEQIAAGALDLSSRTEETAANLQEAAGSMERLGHTVRDNAFSAEQANQLAQGASEVVVRGVDAVGKVVARMHGINQSSQKIADIIGVIDGIAFQTNILALNAAVEAARAGEQGRGFAVVATEVRNLAKRSAESAKEIKALIGQSVDQVEQGTALADQAGKTMNEIVGSIRRVSDIVAEIASASKEQSTGIRQIGEVVAQMDQSTQQNAALVEQSAAATDSLKGQAQQLAQAITVFKLANTETYADRTNFGSALTNADG